MTGERRKRMLMGVAALAGVAFAVDRWLLPPPAPAAAATGAPPSVLPEKGALDPGAAGMHLPSPATLPDEITRATADAFDWGRLGLQLENPEVSQVPPVAETHAAAKESFTSQYQLRATILGPDPIALIGARKMRVGDELSGYVLRAITEESAIFRSSSGEDITLKVPGRRANRVSP
jgi:hypothetical protein